MSGLLAVPLKKAAEVDLATPLRNLLAGAGAGAGGGAPEGLDAALEQLTRARAAAISSSSLDDLYRYHDVLAALLAKVPAQELQVPFKWRDAFDKGSLFAGRISLTLTSVEYERLCVLWNVAAASSAEAAAGVGGGGGAGSDDALRAGARLLQAAAGLYAALRADCPRLPAEPTPDLRADTLLALQALMLAQAQECIAYKCINDEMKDNMVAKVCAACEELYGEALRALQREGVRALWDRAWLPTVGAKQQAWGAMAQLHQAAVCRAGGQPGEELARLALAADGLRAAARALDAPALRDAAARAERRLQEARKDNDFIYHERVPEPSELASIARAAIAAPTPPPARFSTNADPFAALVPLAARGALQAAEARRGELVSAEIARLRDATALLDATLASLGLPAALEEGAGLPAELRERAASVRAAGGLAALERRLQELPELLTRNKEILDEARRMLREEEEADAALRAQFGPRWTRTESAKLTEAFRANAAKYAQIIDNAVRADSIVQDKLRQHRADIELLERGGGALEGAVPAGAGPGGAGALRPLVARANELKAQRVELERALQALALPGLADALTAAPPHEHAALTARALDDALGPLRDQGERSLHQQQEVCAGLAAAGGGAGGGGARGDALARLTAAADAYRDLSANLEEGSKFYNDLTQLLVAFQNKVSDYCFARRTEKEELLKDLTQAASRAPPTPTPTPVSEPAVSRAEAPARPAPPAPTPAAPSLPYPAQPQGMPLPYAQAPMFYAPVPQLYNPYATLPHPHPYPQQYPPQQYQQYPQYPPPQ